MKDGIYHIKDDKIYKGYAILSVTEFNIDGSKPRVAYASNKDFKKIVKYYFGKKV